MGKDTTTGPKGPAQMPELGITAGGSQPHGEMTGTHTRALENVPRAVSSALPAGSQVNRTVRL